MHLIERARKYVQSCPPAISGQGGHNQTYTVAVALVNGFGLGESDAMVLMEEYNRTCDPQWSERELLHKVKTAISTPHNKPKGHLLGGGEKPSTYAGHSPTPQPPVKPTPKAMKYSISPDVQLPQPIPDGARALLKAAFKEGEGVRIQIGRTNEDGREVPKDAGITLSAEDWDRKFADSGGPGGVMSNSARNGMFCAINPYKIGGTKDSDVTDYRHALLESDEIGKAEQYQVWIQSGIPCTAIIDSGGKSIHAWVRVDAKDRKEYDERVRILHEHFSGYGVDPKNKNPGRFSRLPDCVRGDGRQELLALNTGAESFEAWLAEQGDLPVSIPIARPLLALEPQPMDAREVLLGARWLCIPGFAAIVGPSGVGKSSLCIQAAIFWAIGRGIFGIYPNRPLKSLLIQAENDSGDLGEMGRGCVAGCNLGPEEVQAAMHRVIFWTETERRGARFFDEVVEPLLAKNQPDLVWIDPVLSYVQGDSSSQEDVSTFLRAQLLPVLRRHNCAGILLQHSGKPNALRDKEQTIGEISYAALGSSEWTNAPRAVLTLRGTQHPGIYQLIASKRGGRLGWKDEAGEPIYSKHIRHSKTPGQIFWEECEPGEVENLKPSKEIKLNMPSMDEFLGLFPETFEGSPESAMRTPTQLELAFRKKGWWRDGHRAMRDAALTAGSLVMVTGTGNGRKLLARPQVADAYHQYKTQLKQSELIKPTTEEAERGKRKRKKKA